MARILIIIGCVFIAAGLLWLATEKLGFGRLPGDFVFERGNVKIYIPLASMLLISVVLSLILWFLGR